MIRIASISRSWARPAALQAVALSLLAGCASGPSDAEQRVDRVQDLARNSEFLAAAEASTQLLKDLPSDSKFRAEVVALQEQISLGSGLEIVRELVFDGREAEALSIIEELKGAHAGVQAVEAWEDRVRRKIADGWFETARLAVAQERFDDARAAYAKSVEFDPSRTVVQDLLAELDRVEAWRADEAEKIYYNGVGNLVEGRLLEAAGDFAKVAKYHENPVRANRREREVNRVLADSRVAAAGDLAKDGHFSAAAKELEAAARLNPASQTIATDLERFQREAAANQMLIEGRSMILRGELDRGKARLEEGLELSEQQKEAFLAELDGIIERRVGAAYDQALGLEHDFQFEPAVAAYEAILEGRDFYKDCRARIDILKDKIADAQRLHAEAAEAGSPEAELALLRQIEVFWPDYGDIQERIQELADKE